MKKVLVGMSGGVDSSVAALLLKKDGYEVIGATMVLFDTDNNQSVIDAKKICEQLNIEHHIIDLKKEFKEHVINNFIDCYKTGKTPNPCIECNRYLKFGSLYDKAKQLGCEFIATGHYARVIEGKLYRAKAIEKDQTYFLYKIKKEVLSHIIFPLEKYNSKDEIREIAKDNDLFVSDKKDSQEICFVPNDDYISYLNNNNIKGKIGNFILKDGTIIGKHNGIMNYTIGQRKGLGISYSRPLYVIEIDSINNIVILGDESDLYSKSLIATNVNLLVDKLPDKIMAKIRYRSSLISCSVSFNELNEMIVNFDTPVKSVTAGQSVVLYDNDICLGGGIIK